MKKAVSEVPRAMEEISVDIFNLLPYLRKCLFQIDRISGEHNMLMSHVQILSLLSRNGSASISDISRTLSIAKPNITLLVDRLIENGYVERVRDTSDRRVVDIVLREEGRRAIKSLCAALDERVTVWVAANAALPMDEFFGAVKLISQILPQTTYE